MILEEITNKFPDLNTSLNCSYFHPSTIRAQKRLYVMEVLNINLKLSWFALVWKTIYIMIITTVSGNGYSAILLSNSILNNEKIAAYAGCKVSVQVVFVRSYKLKDGFYFLPDGRMVEEPPYGYASCVSFSDVEAWKCLNQDGRIYGLECGKDKDGDEFFSGRTPLASCLI